MADYTEDFKQQIKQEYLIHNNFDTLKEKYFYVNSQILKSWIDEDVAKTIRQQRKTYINKRQYNKNDEKQKNHERYKKSVLCLKRSKRRQITEYYNALGLIETCKQYPEFNEKQILQIARNYTLSEIYRKNNKDKIRQKGKEWIQKNVEYIQQYRKRYTKAHISTIKERHKQRKITDPAFRLKENTRVRIWHALKGISKCKKTEKLIGCSFQEYKLFIEKQFKPGMTWDNYGKWHIDHIIPLAAFDLNVPEEQIKAFHYTNTQPMWGNENLKKTSRYNGKIHKRIQTTNP